MTKLIVAVLAVAGALNVMAAYVVQPLGTVEQVTEMESAGNRVLNMDKTSPPMPTDFKGMVEAVGVAREAVELRPDVAMDHIKAAAASRGVTTQRMARVSGEMIAAIETDKAGNKIARIVKDDGSTEVRQLRVLHTARVKEPVKKEREPIGGKVGTGVAGLLAGGAAVLAAKHFSSSGDGGARQA